MRKFTFKLEAVLEQRKHLEHQRQREVAAAQQKLLRLQAELDALVAVKRSSAHDLRNGRLSAAALAAHQRFAVATRHKATALHRHMAEARRELAAAQLVLLDAAKGRKVMEKLREREHDRWAEMARKREASEADEIARNAAHGAAHGAAL